ncbi:MAG: 50S ribosomal protein L11 methyltransferase [Thermoflexales bacterium]|nr:50S ribosomal protein L11 methyltransferase [Thermoflexales bacterium]MCX7938336.1 50S ribosomal protein L11 methyltransferase [Thermoflexales bacterium]MDW8291677.1 50S ribosomal protein L11 methyltransferase [Anaerolineae bacterium]
MQRWLELRLETDAELAEAISEAIFPFVEGGVALEQQPAHSAELQPERWEDGPVAGSVVVRAYLPMDATLEERRRKIDEALHYLRMVRPVPEPSYAEIAARDWVEAWKAHYKPLRIGERVLVCPSWITLEEAGAQPEDITLVLDPGMAFGTGLHPTTQLCMQALLARVQPGMRVLDVGCGSGILAILAAKLGAAHVIGVDTDPEAVQVARENVARNAVSDRVHILAGSFEVAPGHYHLVVANILSGVIVRLLRSGLWERGEIFVFSGILDSQVGEVIEAAAAVGLACVAQAQMEDWVALTCARTTPVPHHSALSQAAN